MKIIFPKFLFIFIIVFGIGILYCVIESPFGVNKKKEIPTQIIKKNDYVFELMLLSDKELAQVFPLIKPCKDKFSSETTLYVFGSVQFTRNTCAWITFEVFSPNNKTASSPEITIDTIPPNSFQKIYFLSMVHFAPPSKYLKTVSREDTILDIKILKEFFKG